MRQVPRRAWYNVAVNGPILVRNLHQDRAIYGNMISRSTRHLSHYTMSSRNWHSFPRKQTTRAILADFTVLVVKVLCQVAFFGGKVKLLSIGDNLYMYPHGNRYVCTYTFFLLKRWPLESSIPSLGSLCTANCGSSPSFVNARARHEREKEERGKRGRGGRLQLRLRKGSRMNAWVSRKRQKESCLSRKFVKTSRAPFSSSRFHSI